MEKLNQEKKMTEIWWHLSEKSIFNLKSGKSIFKLKKKTLSKVVVFFLFWFHLIIYSQKRTFQILLQWTFDDIFILVSTISAYLSTSAHHVSNYYIFLLFNTLEHQNSVWMGKKKIQTEYSKLTCRYRVYFSNLFSWINQMKQSNK